MLKRITAIVRTERLEAVERGLQEIEVSGITVTQCKGYGEYDHFVKFGYSLLRARIDIYCAPGKTEKIAETIMEKAHTGEMGDGVIAIEPVEKLYRIRTRTEARESEI